MKTFNVYYNDGVNESALVAKCATLEEAKAYANGETKGYAIVGDCSEDVFRSAEVACYEVYEGEPIEMAFDEDGEPDDDKTVFNEPVYTTKYFYNK